MFLITVTLHKSYERSANSGLKFLTFSECTHSKNQLLLKIYLWLRKRVLLIGMLLFVPHFKIILSNVTFSYLVKKYFLGHLLQVYSCHHNLKFLQERNCLDK